MMGALLISSLIIFPALTSMRVCRKFKSVTVLSSVVSVLCFFIGVVISYVYATPTGASVVIVNIAAFLIFWAVDYLMKRRIHMKKAIAFLSIFALMLTGLAGCGNSSDTSAAQSSVQVASAGAANISAVQPADIFEIKEKMFIAQTNDIYNNTEDYLGKTLKYEGIFTGYTIPETGITYYSVIRYGPGCCGSDGNCGFEVEWTDGREYPNENDWVEAVGVLETYDEDGYTYLRLNLSSLTKLATRGLEYVTQ
jgi:uncharacterized membrane protein YcgQ (UPF0703/DUF1980 family)